MKSRLTILSFFLFANICLAQIQEIEEPIIICQMPSLDRKPDFPGGIQNLNKIVKSKIGRKAVVDKTFQFEFTIDKDGKTKSIEILDGKKFFKTRHITKVIESLPKWQPAIQNGKIVESKILAHIVF